ncbi:hypothetical protein [Streptomyces sp. NRRL WC-3742]|uniref:hypothetical protein n=1 Tax=Streptomyces sp. NRRL WC-3742 TaxID=1463934 RepID=UPI0004C67EB2|nr:hypothetical protein [Streptomyces sp. NRRL WC-3742]
MHDLIASPFLNGFVVLRPGRLEGLTLSERRFRDLELAHDSGADLPLWLARAVRARWGVDLVIRSASDAVLIRDAPPYGHGRASWEINLGCDLGCIH